MGELRILVLLAVVVSTWTAASGQQVVSGGSSPADTVYAQPGKLVSVNGIRLNLYCMDEPETVINAIREVYDQTRRPVAAHRDRK